MKKILLSLAFLPALLHVHGQTPIMKATLKVGSTPNTVDIYAMPSVAFSQKDEQVNFALAIPATIAPAPFQSASVVTNNDLGLVAGITGLAPKFLYINLTTAQRQVVVSTEPVNGVPHYIYTFIFSGTAQNPHDWTKDVEQKIFSISFDGCTASCMTFIKLVNLPNGGTTQQAVWYFQSNTSGDITNYAIPFYGNESTLPPIIGGSVDALSVLALPINLPVKIASFNAWVSACNVNLSWQSTQEVNFSYYAIERSRDGISFNEVGRVQASINNSDSKSYSFNDNTSPVGKITYRLRLVDKNGNYAYSTIKAVNLDCHGKNSVFVYPTFSTGLVNVVLPPDLVHAKITIINSIGEVVTIDESKNLNRTLRLKNLANGNYTVRVSYNNKVTENVKIVLQR